MLGKTGLVWLPPDIAWNLVTRAGLGDYALEQRGRDVDVDDALMALRIAAQVHVRDVTSATGSRVDPSPEAPPPSAAMSTFEAAERLGISDRAVRLACSTRRLPATQVGGRWRIEPTDVAAYSRRTA